MWSIYKHTFPNGKVYIGLTKQTPALRFKGGYGYEKCPLMWNAIQKYGWKNIKTEWLETEIATLQQAAQKERDYIKNFNSTNSQYGYNLAGGGQGGATNKYNHEEIINYWYEGLNTSDIKEITGASFATIRRVLDEYNIPSLERRKRQNKIKGKEQTTYDYDKIKEFYLKGTSCKDISLKLGCCTGTVRFALHKMNIPLRGKN